MRIAAGSSRPAARDDAESRSHLRSARKYGRDLTKLAEAGKLDPVIGRDEEVRRVIQVLSRRTKNNPVLIGEPGVGKTAIVEGLAQRIVNGDVPEGLKEIWQSCPSMMGALIAGAKFRGEFRGAPESRLKRGPGRRGQVKLSCSSMSCTPWLAPARPKVPWTSATC